MRNLMILQRRLAIRISKLIFNEIVDSENGLNGGFCSEAQERKCQAIIMQSIYPWLRNLWKKSKSQKGKIDNGK